MYKNITLRSDSSTEVETYKPSTLRNNMMERDNIITVHDAVITSIRRAQGNGYVTIEYPASRGHMARTQVVTLVTGRNTRIRDQFGNSIGLRNLREGMIVNARFSSMMTRSQPPQSRAFSINVLKENESSFFDEGRVLDVESSRGFNYLLTGHEDNIYSQTRYTITNVTLIVDRRGNPIPLRAIRPGQFVRIERAAFQTMSIPPQTTAFTVQVLSNR